MALACYINALSRVTTNGWINLRLQASSLEGVAANDAKLVIGENLYSSPLDRAIQQTVAWKESTKKAKGRYTAISSIDNEPDLGITRHLSPSPGSPFGLTLTYPHSSTRG